MRIILCTEANPEVGYGHIVRCAGLLNLLTFEHSLTVVGAVDSTRFFNVPSKVVCVHDWLTLDWASLGIAQADLIIVDLPFYRVRAWNRFRLGAAKVLAVDDYGGDLHADVVINGTVVDDYHHYPRAAKCVFLLGPQYTLIRSDFAAKPWVGATATDVSFVIGSGDEARKWAFFLARHIAPYWRDRTVHFVVGHGFDDIPALRHVCESAGLCLHVGLSGSDLAELLSHSALAITTGGMILYEAVAIGAPLMVFPQMDDMNIEVDWFSCRGACIDVKAFAYDAAQMLSVASLQLGDGLSMQNMSARQRALIDGRGMHRAFSTVMRLLFETNR